MNRSFGTPSFGTPLAALMMIGLALGTVGCADEAGRTPALGPHDALGLAPVAPERVAVGDVAPDFTLRAHGGGTVTLSDFRGKRDVILVFYRGHW
jgi:cytochrome oxidase Cu insertion factor (SCO1/SenC/PrrC family)